MIFNWVSISSLVLAAIGISGTVIMLLKLHRISRQRQRLTERLTELEKKHGDELAGLDEAHEQKIRQLKKYLIEPFKAGKVVSFAVFLKEDRLTTIELTGRDENLVTEKMPFNQALDIVHPDDRQMVRSVVVESLSRQQARQVVFRTIRDGRIRYFHGRGRVVADGENSFVMQGTLVEITDLQESRIEQARWAQILESCMDLLPFGIMAFDEAGVVTIWNAALEDITGIGAGAVIGCNVETIQKDNFRVLASGPDEKDASHFRVNIFSDQKNQPCDVFRIKVWDRDEKSCQEFRVVTPVRTSGHKNPGCVEMEALGRLTAGVAHDFANQIQVILGYTDILQQEIAERHDGEGIADQIAQDLRQIQEAGERANELVRQILAFDSPETPDPNCRDIKAVISDFMGIMKRVGGEKAALRIHPSEDECRARVDESMLKKILLRTMVHIMDSVDDGTLIVISIKPVNVDPDWPVQDSHLSPGSYVKVSVSCANTGWAENVLGVSPDSEHDGATMIRLMGGTHNVHESPDIGTTLSIYLKNDSCGTEKESSRNIDGGKSNENGIPPPLFMKPATILVAEDDVAVRRLTAKALKMVGHSVLEAADGNEALNIFKKYPKNIDLLITDVIMPGLNGRELCEEIARIRSDLPVLFCSGYSSDLLKNEYMVNIRGLVIQKPFRSVDLLATTARLLG